MADWSFALSRAVGIWVLLVAVESIHGVMRRLLLEPQLGDLRARQVSVFTGAALIALVFWLTLGWLRPQPVRRWWIFGLLWLVALSRQWAADAPCPFSTRDQGMKRRNTSIV